MGKVYIPIMCYIFKFGEVRKRVLSIYNNKVSICHADFLICFNGRDGKICKKEPFFSEGQKRWRVDF